MAIHTYMDVKSNGTANGPEEFWPWLFCGLTWSNRQDRLEGLVGFNTMIRLDGRDLLTALVCNVFREGLLIPGSN